LLHTTRKKLRDREKRKKSSVYFEKMKSKKTVSYKNQRFSKMEKTTKIKKIYAKVEK
jgi:hypothetical protein